MHSRGEICRRACMVPSIGVLFPKIPARAGSKCILPYKNYPYPAPWENKPKHANMMTRILVCRRFRKLSGPFPPKKPNTSASNASWKRMENFMSKFSATLLAPFALFPPCFCLGALFGGSGAGSATGNVVQGLQYGFYIWIFATVVTLISLFLKPEKEKDGTGGHSPESTAAAPSKSELCDR